MKIITQRIPRIAKSKNHRLVKNLAITVTYEQFLAGEPFRKVKSELWWWRREVIPAPFGGEPAVMICKFERSRQNIGSTTFSASIEEEKADSVIIFGSDSFEESFSYRLIFKK